MGKHLCTLLISLALFLSCEEENDILLGEATYMQVVSDTHNFSWNDTVNSVVIPFDSTAFVVKFKDQENNSFMNIVTITDGFHSSITEEENIPNKTFSSDWFSIEQIGNGDSLCIVVAENTTNDERTFDCISYYREETTIIRVRQEPAP